MTGIRRRLEEVFGDPTNVAPGGTGAVLTTPSALSADLVKTVASNFPMDEVYYHVGKIVADHLATAFERQGLKASDYASVPELRKVMAKRITSRLHSSEQFSQGLVEGLLQRG